MKIEVGSRVKVRLPRGHFHVGEYRGIDPFFRDIHYVDVVHTTVPGVKKNPKKKYISTFRASRKQLEVLK